MSSFGRFLNVIERFGNFLNPFACLHNLAERIVAYDMRWFQKQAGSPGVSVRLADEAIRDTEHLSSRIKGAQIAYIDTGNAQSYIDAVRKLNEISRRMKVKKTEALARMHDQELAKVA
jgi:hypothetical protein